MRYETASLLLAGLATPLVLSVHTVISFDFAVAVLPGWHTTIFPPYFVAGAIYSGFAMVLTLAIPLRKFYHLEQLVTERHIDNMGKVMLVTGFIVAYGYGMEAFMAWYSAIHWEAFTFWNRAFGPMGWSYWVLITCNLAIPLTTLWSRKLRTNITFMFFISIVVNTGMWFERFVIVVTSLYARLSAVVVGHLSRDQVGLHDLRRHAGILHVHVPVVRALPAHDSHERNSHVAARGQDQAQGGREAGD